MAGKIPLFRVAVPPVLAYIVAMVRSSIFGIAISLLVLLTGCTSIARRLEVSTVQQIRAGTERGEVERILRKPDEVMGSADGRVIARYFFHQFRVSTEASAYGWFNEPGTMLIRMLTLMYDGKGVVERKVHDESVTPVRRMHTGWYEFGPLLESESVSLQRGKDTAKDAIKLFGEPMGRSIDKTGHDLLIWFYFKERPDYLGQPVAKRLTVTIDTGGNILDYLLVDDNPRVWFQH